MWIEVKMNTKFEVKEMHLEKAISRLNNIHWSSVGTAANIENADLGYEFLRRLACFFKERQLTPKPPGLSNIADLLGDAEGEIELSEYCSSEAIQFLNGDPNVQRMIKYYLQLARYAEKNSDAQQYLTVYDPLITIIEREGLFSITLREFVVKNGGSYPLSGWYERFIEKTPLDISNLK